MLVFAEGELDESFVMLLLMQLGILNYNNYL